MFDRLFSGALVFGLLAFAAALLVALFSSPAATQPAHNGRLQASQAPSVGAAVAKSVELPRVVVSGRREPATAQASGAPVPPVMQRQD